MSALPSARNALDLIASLQLPGSIDPGLAQAVVADLRRMLASGQFGPEPLLL